MQAAIRLQASESLSKSKTFKAVICAQCGVKLYPAKLLKSHLHRHRLMRRWFDTELKKLQHTISHMRSL
jgi:hypothetical protein